MADPRFFTNRGPIAVKELAKMCGAELHPAAMPDKLIHDVAPLDKGGNDDIGFLDNSQYVDAFRHTALGACFVKPERQADAPAHVNLLLTNEPYRCFALAASAFYPEPERTAYVSDAAIVDETAVIGDQTSIRAGAVIEAGARVGSRCVIEPNAVIGRNCVVGDDCVIGAGASLSHCLIGDRVRIYAGARIGEAGFGFATGPEGYVTVPQLGRVIVGDGAEIGANSTIDRGAGPDTVIGEGCRIDNLVQIGHNVELGRRCIVVAQGGISGSTKLDDFVVVAAQAGLTGHLTIGKGAQLGAQSGIMRDVPPGARMMGSPAVPAKQFFRQFAMMSRLAEKKGK